MGVRAHYELTAPDGTKYDDDPRPDATLQGMTDKVLAVIVYSKQDLFQVILIDYKNYADPKYYTTPFISKESQWSQESLLQIDYNPIFNA